MIKKANYCNKNNRVEFVDLAKGICICLVVLLHVYGESAGNTFEILNMFRMPLYFVLSGLFFKPYSGFSSFAKKKVNKLLIPFLITYIVICVPSILLFSKEMSLQSFWTIDSLKPNLGLDGAAWFLLCLFFQNIIFYLIFKVSKHNIYIVILFGIIIGYVGYSFNKNGANLPLWVDSAMTAMPYFLFGYIVKKYSSVLSDKMTLKYYSVIILSIIILLLCHYYNIYVNCNTIVFGENNFDVNIISLYLGGISGFCLVFLVSKYINRIPIISYIGRYSIVVLLTHLLYLFVIRNILYQLGANQTSIVLNFFVFVFIMLISVPTINICIKYLPYWFAQKDLID